MRREELSELHYITPIGNLPSIFREGILSHRLAKKVSHASVAMEVIQEKRKKVQVPGGRPLHEYVNLYLCARNPMMFKIVSERSAVEICVLRVSAAVVDLPNVVVADQNASSNHVRFAAAPGGLQLVDRALVFAEYWTHPDDQIAVWRHKSIKCAEVLVPDRVAPEHIEGAYVSCEDARREVSRHIPELVVTVNAHLFFR